ncbi:MAG: hypothetical protein RLZZ182_466, partial [Pseudomonadota bacterium]
ALQNIQSTARIGQVNVVGAIINDF